MIKINETFDAERINEATNEYPHGSYKDCSEPSKKDGTPLKNVTANDTLGFYEKLVKEAEIEVSGTPDTALKSDIYDSLIKILDNRYKDNLVPIGTTITAYVDPNSQYFKDTFNNYLVIDGKSWKISDYPILYSAVKGLPNFSETIENGTFSLLSDDGRFTRAKTESNSKWVIGGRHGDAIRNIEGRIGNIMESKAGGDPSTGSMYSTNVHGVENESGSGVGLTKNINFDASRSVPTADENQPLGTIELKLIKAK